MCRWSSSVIPPAIKDRLELPKESSKDPRAILRGKGSNLEHLRALRRNLQAAREHVLRQSGDVFKSLEIIWVMGDDAFPHFRQKFIENPHWASSCGGTVFVGKFRLCVVHNRPSQRTHIDPAGLPFEVLEADAPPELSADLSATALRKAWLEGADDDPSPSAASAASASASPQSKDELKTVLASALSSQRTLRLEADPCTVPVQGAASELTLATRLAQLSPEQRLALQELLDVAEKVPQTAKPPDVAPTEKKTGDGWQMVQGAWEIRLRELFETTGWPGQSGAVYIFMRPGAAKLDAFLAMLAAAAAYPEDVFLLRSEDPGDAANLALECRERKCRSMSFFVSSTLKRLPAAVLVNRRFLIANSADVIKTTCGHFEESFRRALVDQPVAGEAQVLPEQEQSEEDPDDEEEQENRGDAASVWVSWLRRNRLHQMMRYDGDNLRLDGLMHRPALSKGISFRARAQKTGEVSVDLALPELSDEDGPGSFLAWF
eukprot:symbB.v1.2.022604.t2/scaffold2000.1/size92914/3